MTDYVCPKCGRVYWFLWAKSCPKCGGVLEEFIDDE